MNRSYTARLRAATGGCILSALLAVSAHAVESIDLLETWESGNLAGWTNSTDAASLYLGSRDGNSYLGLSFQSQTIPVFADAIAKTPVEGVLLTNISFRFMTSSSVPSAVRLYIHGKESGNSWYVNLPKPAADGWTLYNVRVDFSAKWIDGPESRKEAFLRDVRSVDWVGVYVRRGGEVFAQNYGVDDFRLQGAGLASSISIYGAVLYSGEQEGPIYVSAISSGTEGPSTGVTVSVEQPGSYAIAGLPPYREYRVSAFRDSNTNLLLDQWEASGSWGNPLFVSYDLANVDMEIRDPSTVEGLPYWWIEKHLLVGNPFTYVPDDSDRDGMSDYAEYRAGTDPSDSGSQFEISIQPDENTGESAGIILWWASLRNRTYSLWRTESLTASFVRIEKGLVATPPSNVYRDNTATNAGPYFYRVEVDP